MKKHKLCIGGLPVVALMGLTALMMGAPCNFDNSNVPDANPNPVSNPDNTPPTGTPPDSGNSDGGSDTGGGDNTGGGDVTGTVQTYTCYLYCQNGSAFESAGCKDGILANSLEAAQNYAAQYAICANGKVIVSCEYPGTPCH
jgi:hypothetical protein